jgi:hypothetical protein
MPTNFVDHKGITWVRSADLTQITSTEGVTVLGNPEMSDQYLVGLAYQQPEQAKTDAERIAELEAQIAILMSKFLP